jgi:hypothetical protein
MWSIVPASGRATLAEDSSVGLADSVLSAGSESLEQVAAAAGGGARLGPDRPRGWCQRSQSGRGGTCPGPRVRLPQRSSIIIATRAGTNRTDGTTAGRVLGRRLWARWRREQEFTVDAAVQGWECDRQWQACAARQVTAGRTGQATHRGRIPEADGPFGLESLPYPWLKWGRALTNTPRSSGPVFAVHFT